MQQSRVGSSQLYSIFVERPQLRQLADAFEHQDCRGVLLTGEYGTGKTALACEYAYQSADLFPGGLHNLSPHADETELKLVIPRNSRSSSPCLLILDDMDIVPAKTRARTLDLIRKHPAVRAILISRNEIPVPQDYRTIHVDSLTPPEFREFITRLAAQNGWRDVDSRLVEQLYRASDGTPRLAHQAFEMLRRGAIGSLDEFLLYARKFHTPGLVDLDGRPLKGGPRRKLIVEVRATNDEILERLKSDPELARSLPSRRFEEIVAELLQDMGYYVQLTPESKDGGVDIYAARKDGLGSFLFLVECKRFAAHRKVGVNIVRSLYGVLQRKNANAGAIVTTSYFSSDAKDFRQTIEHQMQLHDYIGLQKWIAEFPLKRR